MLIVGLLATPLLSTCLLAQTPLSQNEFIISNVRSGRLCNPASLTVHFSLEFRC